ncbi:SGNH/GDSL hydrolase family protein [Limosilactobacillus reuteri]|uniref:SGNH/GDSL hydrolase family protein n=1 Tax=Limosilactobacillus reuteri TaxID=1598 RepID=UPI003D05CE05
MQTNLIKFNTYKLERGGLLVPMYDQFNARVGDQGTPLVIQWTQGTTDTPVDLQKNKLHFYATGQVGKYLEKLDDGTGYKMSADASGVEYDDKDSAGTQANGITVAKLPKQFFPQEGIFYGYFGLKDDQGNVYSSINVWFRVLGGVPIMGAAIPYFSTRFDELMETCKGRIEDVLAQLRQEYQDEVKKNEDMSAETRASLSKLADAVGAIQAQIDANDVVTLPRYSKDIKNLTGIVENKLTEVSSNYPTVASLDDLKGKFPNGQEGLFINQADGHKYMYINGAWTDCGIFQSVGIADRSITSKQLQERASGVRVIQHDPWIIDFAKKTVIVSTQSYIYDDTLIEIPSQKYSVDSGQNITNLAFDPQTKEIIPYVNYYDIPVHSYYVGMIDFTQNKIFSSFQAVTPKQLLEDSRYPIFGNYNPKYISTDRNNLPAPNSFVVTYQEWSVAFQDNDAVVTVPYADYYFKDMILNIPSKGYQLSDLAGKKSVAYFLYLKIHMSDNPSAELKATTDMSTLKEQDIYIGWVDTSRKMYSLPHPQSAGLESSFKLIGQTGPITVDWDNSTLNLPYIDSVVGDLAGIMYTASITPASLPLKATVGMNDNGNVYFVGLDISKPQWILTSNMSQISTGYLLGWIDKSTRRYAIAGYMSPNLEYNNVEQQFSGKNISCLGDSITSGGNSGINNKTIGKYTDYLSKLTGAGISNAGYSGSHVAKQTGSTDSFVDRASTVRDQDVVLIFGGINDFCFNSPLGDASSTDVTTFYGALKSVIDTVLSNNAEAQLLLVTPYKTKQYGGTYSQDGSLRRNDAGATEEQYVNAIKEVGSYYSIPVLDLYNSGNFNAFGKQSDLLTVDGLHPSDKGAQRLAKTIAHAINNL